jgi:hypothetical protein
MDGSYPASRAPEGLPQNGAGLGSELWLAFSVSPLSDSWTASRSVLIHRHKRSSNFMSTSTQVQGLIFWASERGMEKIAEATYELLEARQLHQIALARSRERQKTRPCPVAVSEHLLSTQGTIHHHFSASTVPGSRLDVSAVQVAQDESQACRCVVVLWQHVPLADVRAAPICKADMHFDMLCKDCPYHIWSFAVDIVWMRSVTVNAAGVGSQKRAVSCLLPYGKDTKC